MIPLVILALMMGIARIVLDLRVVFGSPTIAAGFDLMVTNILSMFVIIELLRSIIEYFELSREAGVYEDRMMRMAKAFIA